MRVLLLDEGFISGTVAARGLRRAGCAVDVIAATGGTGHCRVGTDRWRLAPRVGDPRLLDVLNAADRSESYDIIYPVTEPLQWLVWDARPHWHDRVYPAVDAVHRAARRDKRVMSELVSRHGVSIPQQLAVDGPDALRRAAHELGFPLVIKGTRGRGGNATSICSSLDEAWLAVQRFTAGDAQAFAQAHVRGTTYLAGGLFERGRALRFYAGAKTLQWPARTGPAAELTSVHDSALTELAIRVFSAARVSGLASIDVIRGEDGCFHFLELNPRPWGSIAAAEGADVDLFEALVRLWRAECVVPQLEYRDHVRSPVFPLYLLAAPYWTSGRAARALLPDAGRALALAQQEPQFAGHVLHRLMRVGLNW